MDRSWKTIDEFPDYEISNDGLVRRAKDVVNATTGGITSWPGRLIKQAIYKGYYSVGLYKDKKPKQYQVRIHQMVAKMFIGQRPEGMQVNHIDGNKLNNRVENLEYVTPAENTRHAHRTGLARGRRGTASTQAKLTDNDVREIRRLSKSGMMGKDIAVLFGIHKSRVSSIILRQSWSHVPDDDEPPVERKVIVLD